MSCCRRTQPPRSSSRRSRRARRFGLAVPVIASYCDPAGKAANVQTAESEFASLPARDWPLGQSSSVRDGCVRIMDRWPTRCSRWSSPSAAAG